ncbi:Eco57I restriction-modification methylase domain-containing protein [Ectopseudomonas khazarica]|uniref:Eco57I restriction-modification methylase domain-containing protein n=1 Tax=Ectopseudomonas khazarica TaxID=2502979 RepID=UPI001FC95811|nr:Eco57I restriction-modification methylase domain-containing protein [Pseudomonas khazarica]
MANMFPVSSVDTCRLLDAGAGVGALSCAFLDRWKAGDHCFQQVEATAYEIDDRLRAHLTDHLAGYAGVTPNVIAGDYIELTAKPDFDSPGYTHAILNPPYKKINTGSAHRLALRSVGIETVNLYSAFVALAVAQMAPGGQIVAIIPRSFCNGPYYKPFREFVLKRAAIRHIHLFNSRSTAFKDDEVLQENIIISLECGGDQKDVTITTSTDDSFSDIASHVHPFNRIVFEADPERFIHVPTSAEEGAIERSSVVCCSPEEVGVKISTGPVVGFRMRSQLREMPEPGTVPLLYPNHFSSNGLGIVWPGESRKKPSAILRNDETEKWLYPNGFYCLVRRFSSKEEKRRIVARVLDPNEIGDSPMVGLENYFNVFHDKKKGLQKELAYGLAIYLNSTAVDQQFRRFNGHTQVNATDLKLMKYPDRDTLINLGSWALQQNEITQESIDMKMEETL